MRKLTTIMLLAVFLCQAQAYAADGEYSVSRISPLLLVKANAVLRLEEVQFEISSTRRTVLKNHYVITILNEKGDDLADCSEYYDKQREIISIEGILYDASGKQLKKVKKKDMQDVSGVSDGSLMDDNRVKTHNFYYRIYPYTIEYTIETSTSGSLFFPMWTPQGSENLSVEKSTMQIICDADYQFRYKAFKYDAPPVISQEKNRKVYTWAVTDMPAIVRESYSPLWHELTTVVIFGPTDFQMEDYKGNMRTWQDFGKFVYSLKQGRDQLPEAVKQNVHRLADGIRDPREKVSRLYQYMQQNTRYVSIQLGIGGWQPFDASYVASKGYGDCKALSNYMYSLLKEAGIASYYALVRSGKNSNYITEDFPSQQFDHVILCAPLGKDTMWLECTSQTMQPGYLGDFTSNRPALLIDAEGGKLVRTPKYGVHENLQTRNVKAVLLNDGTLNVEAVTRYGGMQQDNLHGMITHLSKEKVKEYLHEQLDFATYDISRFDYREENTVLPAVNEVLDITVSNYATITGKRLFINPNIMNRSYSKLSQDTSRMNDILLSGEYTDTDSIEVLLPEGYRPEALPADVTLKNKFGKYTSSVKLKDNKLLYYRSKEQYSGRFPPADYEDLVKFYATIYKADRNRVVLVKNETPLKAF